MPRPFNLPWMMAEYDILAGLMKSIGECEEAMEKASAVDNAEQLRDAADSLQRVRELFWPRWTELQQRWPRGEERK